jgi:spermidine/putrescine transport system ATP-binding protein
LLLLDEPLGALDLKLRKQMQVELKRIQQEVGITFIYVTHDQEEAMTMSDRIAVMNQGHYEQIGDPEELYERPRTRFVAGFLGVSNLLHGRADGSDDGYAQVRLADDARVRVRRELIDGRSEVEVGVRPEKIRLAAADAERPGAGNVLTGTVLDASYLGVSTQYIVELASGERVTIYEQNVDRTVHGSLHRPGEQVQLAWSPDHTFVVDPGASARAAAVLEETPEAGIEA